MNTFVEVEIKGRKVLIDECDVHLLSRGAWRTRKNCPRPYVTLNLRVGGQLVTQYLHREIMGVDKGVLVDHINGNVLDNRRCNLRIATHSQNLMNSKKKCTGRTSRFKGVGLHKSSGLWRANIRINGRLCHLGYFTSEVEAAFSYDMASLKHHGDFGIRNFLPLVR